jgi:hypothetical protein
MTMDEMDEIVSCMDHDTISLALRICRSLRRTIKPVLTYALCYAWAKHSEGIAAPSPWIILEDLVRERGGDKRAVLMAVVQEYAQAIQVE